MPLLRTVRSSLPNLAPPLAFTAALAAICALSPTTAAAENAAPSSEKIAYVNTQFVKQSKAKESGRLIIRNTSILPRTVYARFQMPEDPDNRNYGFMQTVPALSAIAYDLPAGVRVFACDGRYWDDYRPDEAFAVMITDGASHQFSHAEFKPTALRRAKGE